jgi:hypothetical protein
MLQVVEDGERLPPGIFGSLSVAPAWRVPPRWVSASASL